jgi:hypothetical protein
MDGNNGESMSQEPIGAPASESSPPNGLGAPIAVPVASTTPVSAPSPYMMAPAASLVTAPAIPSPVAAPAQVVEPVQAPIAAPVPAPTPAPAPAPVAPLTPVAVPVAPLTPVAVQAPIAAPVAPPAPIAAPVALSPGVPAWAALNPANRAAPSPGSPAKPQITGAQSLVFDLMEGAIASGQFKTERDAAFNVMLVLMESLVFSTGIAGASHDATLKQLFQHMGGQITNADVRRVIDSIAVAKVLRMAQPQQK